MTPPAARRPTAPDPTKDAVLPDEVNGVNVRTNSTVSPDVAVDLITKQLEEVGIRVQVDPMVAARKFLEGIGLEPGALVEQLIAGGAVNQNSIVEGVRLYNGQVYLVLVEDGVDRPTSSVVVRLEAIDSIKLRR